MESKSREARRRRIVERGSDRLALITGRIPALQPSDSQLPSSSQSHDLDTLSSPPLISRDQDLQPHLLSDQSSTSPYGEVKAFDSNDSCTKSVQVNGYNGGSREEPFLQKCDTSIEALRTPSSLEVSGEIQSSLVSSAVQESSISTSDTEQHLQPQTHDSRFFTPKQISSAITASESTRIFCSITVALLVVLSYLGFPLLGSSFIKSIIFTRPLFLVLLTNLTIVLARPFLERERHFVREGAIKAPLEQGYGWAEQAGKALEVGLLLQKIIDAVFMDCSVYVIIVICGISLAQQLNW